MTSARQPTLQLIDEAGERPVTMAMAQQAVEFYKQQILSKEEARVIVLAAFGLTEAKP